MLTDRHQFAILRGTMAKRLMTIEGVKKLLSKEVEKAGSQRALACHMGISVQFISRVLAGEVPPGKRVLDWLDLEEAGMRYTKRMKQEPADQKPKARKGK